MIKKNVLITGVTGDIGYALAFKYLEKPNPGLKLNNANRPGVIQHPKVTHINMLSGTNTFASFYFGWLSF